MSAHDTERRAAIPAEDFLAGGGEMGALIRSRYPLEFERGGKDPDE